MNKSELENEIERRGIIILDLQNLIAKYEAEYEDFQKMKSECQKLKDEYTSVLSELYWKPTSNERGAGRKSMLTPEFLHEVNTLRAEGLTQMDIAIKLSVSVGLVNKACNTRVHT